MGTKWKKEINTLREKMLKKDQKIRTFGGGKEEK